MDVVRHGALSRFGEHWPPGQRWPELAPMYAAAFGSAASVIGPPEDWKASED
jgi:hypothetical protein